MATARWARTGCFFPGSRESVLSITSNLVVLEGSSSVPATSPYQIITPLLSTLTNGWFASGESVSRNVLEGYTLELDQLLVSPGESVVIQVVFFLICDTSLPRGTPISISRAATSTSSPPSRP